MFDLIDRQSLCDKKEETFKLKLLWQVPKRYKSLYSQLKIIWWVLLKDQIEVVVNVEDEIKEILQTIIEISIKGCWDVEDKAAK